MFRSLFAAVFLLTVGVACWDCSGINAISPQCKGLETAYEREYFYVGGRYVHNATTNSTLMTWEMYVEKLTPLGGATQPHPIILMTAGVPSGAAWLNTPDGRKGWASWFIEQKYQVYILDTTGMGRSTQNDVINWIPKGTATVIQVEEDYVAPQLFDPYPQSQLHTQWPGNGTQGDSVFDAFIASFLPLSGNGTNGELSMREAGCALLKLIGPSFITSHSGSAVYATLWSDQCPNLITGNINIEAGNTPFQNYVGNASVPAVGTSPARPYGLTTTAIHYVPPVNSSSELHTVTVGIDTLGYRSCIRQVEPARKLPAISSVPYLMITGEASPHVTYDHCTIEYLIQVGGNPDWIKLADIGIHGNGHFSYLEKNNLQVAEVVHQWIQNRTRV